MNRAARVADGVLHRGLQAMFVGKGLPPVEAGEFEALRARAEAYASPERLADPESWLGPGDSLEWRVEKRRRRRSGAYLHRTATSPYRPLDPLFQPRWSRRATLRRMHLHSWVHDEVPRASIILIHGWAVGAVWMHWLEFGIPYLHRRLGLDVHFYVLPYHGARKPEEARFSGELYPSIDIITTNEAFVQTVRELRTLVRHLGRSPDQAVGMMGSSVGGYSTALVASLEPELDFAIPVMPPANLAELFWDHGEGMEAIEWARNQGLDRAGFASMWAFHSPLAWTPKVPRHARMIVTASGDPLIKAEHTAPLWEHWQRPRHFAFAGGHLAQFGAPAYHREVGRFLSELDLL